MNDEIKLVVFDLNETLISENTWYELNMAMGVTPTEDAQFMSWYEEGIISYEEGQKFLERIYLSRGQGTYEKMMFAMKYSYKSGAHELIKYLKSKGIEVALLSGAIDLLVEKVALELDIKYFAAHNKLQFNEEGRFQKIVCEGDDSDFKVMETKKYCDALGINMKQVVCVGDGYNDVKLFEMTGHGVTFVGAKIEDKAWRMIESLDDVKKIV